LVTFDLTFNLESHFVLLFPFKARKSFVITAVTLQQQPKLYGQPLMCLVGAMSNHTHSHTHYM